MTVYSKMLLVEGKQEIRVIPELVEANGVEWGSKKNPVVYIRDYDGYQNLVNPDVISAELKASGLVALGIILDADADSLNRWQSLRNACVKSIPDIPETLPAEGLIHPLSNGLKFGVWIMPDNKMRGMLETFLAYMISTEHRALWEFAQEVSQTAKNMGASFTEPHTDKANIYSWLAWQNPPGRQLHQAIIEKILDPKHPNAQCFVTWFKSLYDLV
jgi:hypothetical protein